MNAALSIEIEILEPVLLSSADQMLQLHPTQIRWMSIRLTSSSREEGEAGAAVFSAQSADTRLAIYALVELARQSQPGGTVVTVWYQGRSEEFVI